MSVEKSCALCTHFTRLGRLTRFIIYAYHLKRWAKRQGTYIICARYVRSIIVGHDQSFWRSTSIGMLWNCTQLYCPYKTSWTGFSLGNKNGRFIGVRVCIYWGFFWICFLVSNVLNNPNHVFHNHSFTIYVLFLCANSFLFAVNSTFGQLPLKATTWCFLVKAKWFVVSVFISLQFMWKCQKSKKINWKNNPT